MSTNTGWKYAISEVTTINNTFEEDVQLYARYGAQGIGVWGFKMEEIGPERARKLMAEHNLGAANCIPNLNSILPYVLSPEPTDPMKRVEAFLPNMESMAKLNPETIVVITGPLGDYSLEEAGDLCRRGFERIGQAANDLGVTVALEPIHSSVKDVFTLIWDVPGALEMLREINQPNFKLLFDTWHLWDTPDIFEHIRNHIDLIAGVHIADWREDTRTWADRAFPGEGKLPMLEILNALNNAGFRGYYDVEIFSDNGQYDTAHPDSLWKLPPEEIADRATQIFRTTRPGG
jgi:sugar phosphate isomerase/epimerase